MMKTPVIAIFDVGKTNKKLFLFDKNYNIVFERSARFSETVDEDEFPCENLQSLRLSVYDSLSEVFRNPEFEVKAINFSTYGASFVHLDEEGKPLTPLYSYLKPYPEGLKKQFYETYGGEEEFSFRTASPVLGSLNSGMQLYRIKYEKPDVFKKIKTSLHLPQYMSFLVSGQLFAELTSIGCHTNLWDFTKNEYHEWVKKEGIHEKLPPIVSSSKVVPASFPGSNYLTGVGLHDSSAALIPYLASFQEPFVLVSTGTWCISLNPFNHTPLTSYELANDCLSFISYQGKPVKASRLFAGYEHEQQVKKIAAHFNASSIAFRNIPFNAEIIAQLQKKNKINPQRNSADNVLKESIFEKRELSEFSSAEEAYHQLMLDLVEQQYASTSLVLKEPPIKRMYVDGGFSKNDLYMNLLAIYFPDIEVYAASIAQATALGTAMAIHQDWNSKPVPSDIVKLKLYSPTPKAMI